MQLPEVGEIITSDDARRDAIHVAVAPVETDFHLAPGEKVKLVRGKAVSANLSEAIGVVDPFLEDGVSPGQRFWLFLFPNTITSLRHVWSHPAFCAMLPGKENT